MAIEFSDGMVFDTAGPLRIQRRRDGFYVVGMGMLIPVADHAEGRRLIEELQEGERG